MKITYYLAESKQEKLSIQVRLSFSKKHLRIKTGKRIAPDQWNTKGGKPKRIETNNKLRDELIDLKNHIERKALRVPENKLTVKWLESVINESEFTDLPDNSNMITNYITNLYYEMLELEEVTKKYSSHYLTLRNLWVEFEQYQNNRYELSQYELSLKTKFQSWLKTVKKLSPNYIHATLNKMVVIMKNAVSKGYQINSIFMASKNQMRSKKIKSKASYLTDAEIDKLFNYTKLDKPLSKIKDMFVFGCYLGLRYSDLSRLTSENVVLDDDEDLNIEIVMQKTGKAVMIPLGKIPQRLIKFNKGSVPIVKMSITKFNESIKEICRLVGINELVEDIGIYNPKTNRKEFGKTVEKWQTISSHVMRRSLATNLALKGYSSELIMEQTGHKTESQFREYISASGRKKSLALKHQMKKNGHF